jgi:hypothetical protein
LSSGQKLFHAAACGVKKRFFGDTPNPVKGLRPLHSQLTLHASLGLDASLFVGGKQSGMVGIHFGKRGNRLVEDIPTTWIASDLC